MKSKYYLVAVVLATAILFSGSAVSAQTTDTQTLLLQIQAQINWIFEQVKALQAQFYGSSAGEAGIVEELQSAPEPIDTIRTDCFHLYEKFPNNLHESCGDLGYNIQADINNDGTIDLLDLGLYGENEQNQDWCQAQLDDTTDPCDSVEHPAISVSYNGGSGEVKEVSIESLTPEPIDTIRTDCFHLYEKFPNNLHESCGDLGYNIQADINNDGTIDLLDLGLYGENEQNQDWCQAQLDDTTDPCEAIQQPAATEPVIEEINPEPESILSTDCFHLYEKLVPGYNKSCGDELYYPEADINKDGTINLLDMGLYGENSENQTWCQAQLDDTTNPCVLR